MENYAESAKWNLLVVDDQTSRFFKERVQTVHVHVAALLGSAFSSTYSGSMKAVG